MRDADLQARDARRDFEGDDLERCGAGPRRVVFVGEGCAEHGVQVRALVADRELQDVAAVAVDDALGTADEIVELLRGGGVAVVVDAAEADEHRDGGPQLGEEVAVPGVHSLVDGGQQPLANDRTREARVLGYRRHHGLFPDGADDPDELVALTAPRNELDAAVERGERGGVDDGLAALCMVLGGGQAVHQSAGQHVDQLDTGVADDEAAGLAGGDGHLHAELDDDPRRRGDPRYAPHRLLHRQGAGDAGQPVVAVEPARDGVAAEVHDDAAMAVQLAEDGVEDDVERGGQLFGPPLCAELRDESLGEGGEARDVGKDGRAADPVGDRDPRGEGPPAVTGDVCLDVVDEHARASGPPLARRAA